MFSLIFTIFLVFSYPNLIIASGNTSIVTNDEKTAIKLARHTEAVLVALFVSQTEIPVAFEAVKPALDLAVEEARRRYPHLKFTLIAKHSNLSCLENSIGALAAEEYYLRRVSAFIGPACSMALDPVARMAAYWNIPVFTAGGIGMEFSKKSLYSTLTRLSFSLDRISHFLVKAIREFEWNHISLIVDETENSNVLIRNSIIGIFKEIEFGHEIALDIQSFIRKENRTVNYKRVLQQASRAARVIILITSGELIRHILLEAHELGMGNGEYAFISMELAKSRSSNGDFSWYQPGDKRNKEAREIFEALMVIAVRLPVTQEFSSFVHNVAKLSTHEFGNVRSEAEKSTKISNAADDVNAIVAAFYDAVLMYAWAFNKTLADGEDPSDGRRLVRKLWNSTFYNGNKKYPHLVGLTGNLVFNENGDREADYTLNDLDPETGIMRPVASYFGANRLYEKLKGIEVHWPGGRSTPPQDVPYCGFTGEAIHCLKKEPFPLWATLLIVLLSLLIFGAIISFFFYKKIKLESQLSDLWWKLDWEDIHFIERAKSAASGQRSMVSLTLSEDGYLLPSSKENSIVYSFGAAAKLGINIGVHKGIKVVVKMINVPKIHVNREMLFELKQMRDITHENLVRFVGLCIDEPNSASVSELSIRGSLRDMLENESVKVDWTLRYSMISDIVEGMNFLHSSIFDYHGRLKSSNLVVDGRFMVKVSDYGMRSLYKLNHIEEINPRALFWTAPEHLRERDPINAGSKKGDVYSFAVILQEIITRCGPFESMERLGRKRAVYDPDEILDRLRMGTAPPFRPEVAPDECPKEVLDLMHDCWVETPILRPDFLQIKHKLRKVTKGITSRNFLDNLMKRMEQYSGNLEQMVQQKTDSIFEEKKKTEDLLYQLLPRFVADELKKGHHLKPESYESATVFFSDIVGFTVLAEESTPSQVVNLLNDLYTCVDGIIEMYDVYKVETIGDAYMVVSGLPIRNGNTHVREIARMALDMKRAMQVFKIRHKKNRRLQMRMGMNTGPCVAGVVGLKMPKYCVFGDTVNTASRMETHGEPLKIHISEQTKDVLELFTSFLIVPRGEIEIKGKGTATTFWLESENRDMSDPIAPLIPPL